MKTLRQITLPALITTLFGCASILQTTAGGAARSVATFVWAEI
jgi:uncharacterized protein YceK